MNINKSFNLNREYYKEECIICYEELGSGDIALLECGHKFHNKCITDWSKKKKKSNIICCICDKKTQIINIEKRNNICCNII